jgi:hypothetical protein
MFAFVRRFARLGHLITVLVVAAALSCARDEAPTTPLYSLEDCDIEPEGPMFESSLPCMLDDPNPNALGLFTTWSEEMCVEVTPGTAWQDLDEDGVHDYCENATAAAFAPTLIVASQDCNWDQGLGRMGGEYFWAVQAKTRTDPATQMPYTVLRVAYLPAYYWDCGNASSFPPAQIVAPPHSGDSEFILLDARYDTASHHWRTVAVFLSAHCGTGSDDNCKWYGPSSIDEWVDGRLLGAPYVWVSRGKHANYVTEDQCDRLFEDCELDTLMPFPVGNVLANIGSRLHPMRDCAPPLSNSTMVNHSLTECMWSHNNIWDPPLGRFNGWQSAIVGDPPGPYGRWLAEIAGF